MALNYNTNVIPLKISFAINIRGLEDYNMTNLYLYQ